MNPTPDSTGGPPQGPQAPIADVMREYESSARDLADASTANHKADPLTRESIAAGGRCLQMIEAIRLAEPEYLDDLLGPAVASDHPTPSSTTIGRFLIRRQLGRGGFGVVFLAHDPHLQRPVALKVPRPEALASADIRRRFVREAEAAAALNHPHIVPVFESGTAGPVCYIASAFCDGVTLTDWLAGQGGYVEPTVAARMLVVLADAVGHAHARGVLHRDIKPGNVMIDLARADEDGSAASFDPLQDDDTSIINALRLVDFGMACLPDANGYAGSEAVLGTPAYMAPEQAEGAADQISVATDVYGLGATLYQLIVGRPPFDGESQADVLALVQDRQPIGPRQLRLSIPRDLEAVCLKCLAKRPEHRYGSAASLKTDLLRFLAGRPVAARPLNRIHRLARWSRRRPVMAAAGMLTILMLAFGLFHVVWQWSRAERHLAESRQQQALALSNLRAAEDAVHQLLTEVSQKLRDTPRMDGMRRSLLLKAAELNSRLLTEHTDDEAMRLAAIRAWGRAAEIFEQLGDHPQLQRAIDQSFDLCRIPLRSEELAKERNYELARTYQKRGDLALKANSAQQAIRDFQAAMDLIAKSPPAKKPQAEVQLAELERHLGMAYDQMGQHTTAGTWFQQSVDRMQRLTESRDELEGVRVQRANSHNSLGVHYRLAGRCDDAMREYQHAVGHLQRLVQHYPETARYRLRLGQTRFNMGNLLLSTNDNVQAEVMYQTARNDLEELTRDYPETPSYADALQGCLNGLALAQKRMGRFEEAEESYLKAIKFGEAFAERHPDHLRARIELTRTTGNLAKLLRQQGKRADARRWIRRAVTNSESLLIDDPNSNDLRTLWGKVLIDLAGLDFADGEWAAAKASITRAISLFRQMLEQTPPSAGTLDSILDAYVKLIDVCFSQGEYEEGMQEMRQMLRDVPHEWSSHLHAASTYFELSRLAATEDLSAIGDAGTLQEAAFEALAKSRELGAPATSFAHPCFDDVRTLPRFLEITQ